MMDATALLGLCEISRTDHFEQGSANVLDDLVKLEFHSAFQLHFAWVHAKLASQEE